MACFPNISLPNYRKTNSYGFRDDGVSLNSAGTLTPTAPTFITLRLIVMISHDDQ